MSLYIRETIEFLLSKPITRNRMIIGINLVSYFLGILAGSSDKFDRFKYLSPFKYVDSVDIILNKQMNLTFMIISAAVVLQQNR